MPTTIDGYNISIPPNEAEVTALAQYHHNQLAEATTHQEVRLSDYCMAQRKRVSDFVRQLDTEAQAWFYHVYDGELLRLAQHKNRPSAHAEAGVSYFAIAICLVIIAFILYFSFVRTLGT